LVIAVDAYRSAKAQPVEYKMRFFNAWWFYIVVYLVYSCIFLPLVGSYTKENFVQAYKIPAGSMLPTILIGDHLFVDKRSYKTQDIAHEDLIIFPFPKKPENDYIKRVIGLPGDEIEIRNKQLYLNKVLQKQKFAIYKDQRILPQADSPRDNFGPVTVPEGSVFVLGDNRDNSYDSRFWGFVPIDTVKGKVVNIYWSWDKMSSQVRWERIGLKVD
jgi:signal peptidase I